MAELQLIVRLSSFLHSYLQNQSEKIPEVSTPEGPRVGALKSMARRAQLQKLAAVLAFTLAASSAAHAQWDHATFPGTPHKSDGKVDLTAPVPRTAAGKVDLSGVWSAINFSWVSDLPGKGVTPPMTPKAAELFDERVKSMGEHNPQLYCMPHSLPDAMLVADIPFKMIQTPIETVVLFEEFNQYVQIYTDGRTLVEDPNPAWFGHSTGKWDGDVFVVDVAGFKEGSWLHNVGHPRTEQMHVTMRFHRLNFGSMDLEILINDPGAYTKPWNAPVVHMKLMAEDDLIEHLCENNRDLEHENFFPDKEKNTK